MHPVSVILYSLSGLVHSGSFWFPFQSTSFLLFKTHFQTGISGHLTGPCGSHFWPFDWFQWKTVDGTWHLLWLAEYSHNYHLKFNMHANGFRDDKIFLHQPGHFHAMSHDKWQWQMCCLFFLHFSAHLLWLVKLCFFTLFVPYDVLPNFGCHSFVWESTTMWLLFWQREKCLPQMPFISPVSANVMEGK